jgi:hypothetical protein
LLNNHWVIEEIREEIKKFLEFNENENTETMTKAVLGGKFIAMSAYTKNTKNQQFSQIVFLK